MRPNQNTSKKLPGQARFLCLLILLLTVISACSPAVPAATKANPSITPLATTPAAATLAPATLTSTPTARPTATHTASPTSAPTTTASPVPEPGWDQLKVASVTNQAGGISISLTIPNVAQAYNLFLGGQKYTCRVDEMYPGILFCWGLAIPPVNVEQKITFIDPADGKVAYEGQTVITHIDATGTVVIPQNTCTTPGAEQTCEMECRIDPTNNQPCIVATCSNVCGLSYSIQTCSNDVPLSSFSMCDAETQAEMKKLYNIP